MSFLAVVVALFLERVLVDQDEWRQARWLPSYLAWLRRLPFGEHLSEGLSGLIAALTPPLLLIALIQASLGHNLAGIPSLLFATVVLLYCLGPGNLDAQIQTFAESLEDEDDGLAAEIARDLLGDEPAPGRPSLLGQVVRAIPFEAFHRLFAVLFWFLVLGPLGALLYRLSRQLLTYAAVHGGLDPGFRDATRRLVRILDWAPARLTLIGYALAGSFDDTLRRWREASDAGAEPEALVGQCAAAALRVEDDEPLEEQDGALLIERASALVWRSMLIWLGLLGMLTIAYWAA